MKPTMCSISIIAFLMLVLVFAGCGGGGDDQTFSGQPGGDNPGVDDDDAADDDDNGDDDSNDDDDEVPDDDDDNPDDDDDVPDDDVPDDDVPDDDDDVPDDDDVTEPTLKHFFGGQAGESAINLAVGSAGERIIVHDSGFRIYVTEVSGTGTDNTILMEGGGLPAMVTTPNGDHRVLAYNPVDNELVELSDATGSWVQTSIPFGGTGFIALSELDLEIDSTGKLHGFAQAMRFPSGYMDPSYELLYLEYTTQWELQTIATVDDTISECDLEISNTDAPMIACMSGESDVLLYSDSGSSWSSETVFTTDDPVLDLSLAYKSDGTRFIVYSMQDDSLVRSVHMLSDLGSGFTSGQIDGQGGYNVQLAVDSNDDLHVLYERQVLNNSYLMYTSSGNSWQSEMIQSKEADQFDLYLSQTTPLVAFGTEGGLYTAAQGTPDWDVSTVFASGDSAAVLDVTQKQTGTGKMYLCYRDGGGAISVLEGSGETWDTTDVDASREYDACSIAVDDQNVVHLILQDGAEGGMLYFGNSSDNFTLEAIPNSQDAYSFDVDYGTAGLFALMIYDTGYVVAGKLETDGWNLGLIEQDAAINQDLETQERRPRIFVSDNGMVHMFFAVSDAIRHVSTDQQNLVTEDVVSMVDPVFFDAGQIGDDSFAVLYGQHDSSGPALAIAYNNNGSWDTSTIETSPLHCANSAQIELNEAKLPQVLYWNAIGLHFATTSDGTVWHKTDLLSLHNYDVMLASAIDGETINFFFNVGGSIWRGAMPQGWGLP